MGFAVEESAVSARLVNAMKKWWIIALVFTLALSLTSCAKKRETQNSQGFGYCDGTMGQIDVYVKVRSGDNTRFDLVLVPYTVAAPGDIVSVTVVQKATYQYKEMVSQVVLNPSQQVLAGTLTKGELDTYDVLAITSYQPGVNFLQANPAKSAVCTLPYIGDNLTN